MSANDDLLEILKDALDRLGAISGRRMFGGVGVYFDGIFFAVIDGGVVYFRTSGATRAAFEVERSRAFTYATKNGLVEISSYWSVPERLLDEPGELRDWARDAIAAARDVSAAKERKRRAKIGGRRSRAPAKRTKT